MDFVKENFETIVFWALIVIIGVSIACLVYSFLFNKNFVNKKIKLHVFKEINNENESEIYSFNVINRGFNDTVITALGFIYANQSIDYFNACDLLKSNNDSKVVVPQRDSIKVVMEPKHLEELLLKLNNEKSVKMVYCYVIDSVGNITKGKVKDCYRVIKACHQEEVIAEKARIKAALEEEARLKQEIVQEQKRVKSYMNAKAKAVKKTAAMADRMTNTANSVKENTEVKTNTVEAKKATEEKKDKEAK